MKIKVPILFLCLILALVLADCGAPTVGDAGREEHSVISYYRGEIKESVPATLFQGQGYSIYIPDDGWNKVDFVFDCWEADVAPEGVWIQILPYENCSFEEAKQKLIAEYGFYDFQEDSNEWLSANTRAALCYSQVRLVSNDRDTYAAWIEYPDEEVKAITFDYLFGSEARGHSDLLRAIASSVQISPNTYEDGEPDVSGEDVR